MGVYYESQKSLTLRKHILGIFRVNKHEINKKYSMLYTQDKNKRARMYY